MIKKLAAKIGIKYYFVFDLPMILQTYFKTLVFPPQQPEVPLKAIHVLKPTE